MHKNKNPLRVPIVITHMLFATEALLIRMGSRHSPWFQVLYSHLQHRL